MATVEHPLGAAVARSPEVASGTRTAVSMRIRTYHINLFVRSDPPGGDDLPSFPSPHEEIVIDETTYRCISPPKIVATGRLGEAWKGLQTSTRDVAGAGSIDGNEPVPGMHDILRRKLAMACRMSSRVIMRGQHFERAARTSRPL